MEKLDPEERKIFLYDCGLISASSQGPHSLFLTPPPAGMGEEAEG